MTAKPFVRDDNWMDYLGDKSKEFNLHRRDAKALGQRTSWERFRPGIAKNAILCDVNMDGRTLRHLSDKVR